VIGEKYNRILQEKKARYVTVTRAVSRLMTSLDKRKTQLADYRRQAEEKAKIVQGAKIAGQRRAAELKKQGLDLEAIKVDVKIAEYAAKSTDAGSSLQLLNRDIANLELEMGDDVKELGNFERDIKQMQRDFDDLGKERDRAMAKVASAKERKELYEAKVGVSGDETTELLREVRESVSNTENLTKLAAKTSGYEGKAEEEELIALADKAGSEDFFTEIGLVDSGSKSEKEKGKKEKSDQYKE